MRKTISIVLALFAAMFWYITFTVPMISATAPALLAIALTVAVYFVWPRHHEQDSVPQQN